MQSKHLRHWGPGSHGALPFVARDYEGRLTRHGRQISPSRSSGAPASGTPATASQSDGRQDARADPAQLNTARRASLTANGPVDRESHRERSVSLERAGRGGSRSSRQAPARPGRPPSTRGGARRPRTRRHPASRTPARMRPKNPNVPPELGAEDGLGADDAGPFRSGDFASEVATAAADRRGAGRSVVGVATEDRARAAACHVLGAPLAADLRREFPEMTGLSRSNLHYMRSFAAAWPLTGGSDEIVPQPVGQLPWGHIRCLLDKLKDSTDRLWYANQAIENGWSRSVLETQIATDLKGRQGGAITSFDRALPTPDSELVRDAIKDPYNFEFLRLVDAVLPLPPRIGDSLAQGVVAAATAPPAALSCLRGPADLGNVRFIGEHGRHYAARG